jgi:lauroyl/myristoyl acyltransferase
VPPVSGQSLRDRARVWLVWATRLAGRAHGMVKRRGGWVTEVFPELTGWRAHQLAAVMESNRHAERALVFLRRRAGEDWLERVVDIRGGAILEELRREERPLVAVTWHGGLLGAIPAALARHGFGGLILRDAQTPDPPVHGFGFVGVGKTPQARALCFAKGLAALRRKESVINVTDVVRPGRPGGNITISFLGRRILTWTGSAALARLGGAALVPIVGTLQPGRFTVEVLEPIAPGADDLDTTLRLVSVYETRIAADRGWLWRESLDELRAAPPAGDQ